MCLCFILLRKSFGNERLSYFNIFHGNKAGNGTEHNPKKEILVAD